MPGTNEIKTKHADAEAGVISKENVRWLLDLLVKIPLWWLIAVWIAVVLSCFTITRGVGGAFSVKFAVTTTAVGLLAVAWLPAVIRILAIVFKQGRAFGVEVTGAGLEGLLARFGLHEPPGTSVPVAPQADSEDLESQERPDSFETNFDSAAESEVNAWENQQGHDNLPPAWTSQRAQIYRDNRDIFLVHQIRPSKRPEQNYDVFVFLAGAHGAKPSDIIDQADFFLGTYWRNKVFTVSNQGAGGTIGITTSAYGSTLCLCRVTFKNPPGEVILQRFLDFEMAWVFDTTRQQLIH
jgi:hypothetical protein